ncbi:lamin tail domain-containing protein [Paenibacillus sp. MBLB4367]|uniref:lamin tail domain-containing protein n=1 Tax=Paenibacillus sp. MBLB4367 TaxID=3384767 RepID=UPI00390836E4
MKGNIRKIAISTAAVISVMASQFNGLLPSAPKAFATSAPDLLITELSPNNAGADDYEFIELYNRSDRDLSLSGYSVVYRVPGTPPTDRQLTLPAKSIRPNDSVVLWYNKSAKSAADFNAQYGVNLPDDRLIPFTASTPAGFSGMANTGSRSFIVKDAAGNEIVSADYKDGETNDSGMDVHYKMPGDGYTAMARLAVLAPPTPGTVDPRQVSANLPPVIAHTPLSGGSADQDARILADIASDDQMQAKLYFRTAADMQYRSVAMTSVTGSTYEAVVPKELLWTQSLQYYIEATDNANPAAFEHTASAPVSAAIAPSATVPDYNALPKLLVTELVPDGANVGGSDAYEFIEVYNNTNKPVRMNDYQILYRYPAADNKADVKLDLTEDKVVGPQESFVVWTKPSGSPSLTLADFNAAYGTSLDEGHVTALSWAGMHNTQERTIVIADKLGNELSSARYLESGDAKEVAEGKGILYKYRNGGTAMIKLGTMESATPGRVLNGQAPAVPVAVPDAPNPAPVIDHTPITKVDGDRDLTVSARVTDDEPAAQVKLFYRLDPLAAYKSVAMTTKGGGVYEGSVPKAELWSNAFSYYVEARDAANRVTAPADDSKPFIAAITHEGDQVDANKLPKLLITELVPDTVNIGGSDAYEYIEVYNNTNKPINMKDYQIVYRYPAADQKADIRIDLTENKQIGPQESFAVWTKNDKNTALTVADFNANYQSSLDSGHLTGAAWDGMANGSERTVIIADDFGNEIAAASYNQGATDVAENKSIVYKYPATGNTMVKVDAMAPATPGAVLSGQVPAKPVAGGEDAESPVIAHEPVSAVAAGAKAVFTANVTDNGKVDRVTLFYKQDTGMQFETTAMKASPDQPGAFQAELPAKSLWSKELTYYIEASDGVNLAKTAVSTAAVAHGETDFAKVPQLLVTEIVPDSVNVGGSDGYEFIEIYNNTDRDLKLDDYKLQYRYPDEGAAGDLIWAPDTEGLILKSQKTMVFWIINGPNESKTVADFNANYGTNLVANTDIVRMHNNGMANDSPRGIVVATNIGKELSKGFYWDEKIDDTKENKGILYKYPVDGTNNLIKISSGTQPATPGSVLAGQVPAAAVKLADDTIPPVVTDKTGQTEADETDNIRLTAAAQDDVAVKTVTLYYKANDQTAFTKANLRQDYDDKLYYYTIYSPELLGKTAITYYYEAGDGTNVTKSATKTIAIRSDRSEEPLRLNVNKDQVVTGATLLKGTSSLTAPEALELYVDGVKQTSTYGALEREAYFAFELKKTNLFFKNGVTMGNDILKVYDDETDQYTTLSVPVQPERLIKGQRNVISIRSGTKVSPFDNDSEENRDDFYVRNVRLVLADGTVVRDAIYADPNKELSVGDGTGAMPVVDFGFTIPDEKFNSKAYLWDTKNAAEGSHTVKIVDPTQQPIAESVTNVYVDNTAPVIIPGLVEGREYKGRLVIDAEASDAIAGIGSVEAKLDDKAVTLPMQTSSALLAPGNHKLTVKAIDKAGNAAEVAVNFRVVEEMPHKPELVSPATDEKLSGTAATLQVKVTDPTGDAMDVSFYQGFHYDVNDRPGVKAFANAVDREPPQQQRPEGEAAFTDEEYRKVQALDGNYLVSDSMTQFPYQRFEVKLDPAVDATDDVELVWKGKSLEGRKVTMYAWNHKEGRWSVIDHRVAGTEDFTLQGHVRTEDFAREQTINVMIQDEIPSSPEQYDYTFVWMSDTQYYSESYPHIYRKEVDWIKDNKEDLKIKYVFHTGDIVDKSYQEYQWVNADGDMKVLDEANIPYGVLAGNHDVNHKDEDYTKYSQYFGEDRFKDKPYYGGSYKNNRGHYDLISAGGNDFIMLYMGWGITDEDLVWMNQVLADHPDRKAFLNFHEYLLVSGNRSPIANRIYEKVVLPNPNVIAVLSGHYHDSEMKADEIDDNGDGTADRTVYQMLADYQGGPEGGQGYMRLLHFDTKNNKIIVNTYSPYMNDYNFYDTDQYPGKDEFTINVDLQPKLKRVATDYFAVNVYTDTLVGKAKQTASGAMASANWSGLTANKEYEWYAIAADGFDGSARSDIWSFRSGSGSSSGGSNGGTGGATDSGAKQPDSKPSDKEAAIRVDDKAEIAKLDGATNGRHVIKLDAEVSANAKAPITVEIGTSVLKLAGEKSVDVIFHANGLSITIPANAIPADKLGAGTLTLSIDATSANAQAQTDIAKAASQDPSYRPTGSYIDLKLFAGSELISGFVKKVTVEIGLSQDTLSGLNLDYAGVYYVNGGQAEYVGGTFEGNKAIFQTNHFSTYAVMEYEKQFADMAGQWAEGYVKKLAAKHIAQGMTEQAFAPNETVTRAQFATFLMRALGYPQSLAYAGEFQDVKAGSYYAGYVAEAVKLGIIQKDTAFRPDSDVTREEAVVMLMRAYGQLVQHPANAKGTAFADQSSISEWAKEAVSLAKALGILEGREDGAFAPKASLTRAETAKLIIELLKQK